MKRRSFLAGILAAGMAPAAVGSGILMPVRKVWVPPAPKVFSGIDLGFDDRGILTLYDGAGNLLTTMELPSVVRIGDMPVAPESALDAHRAWRDYRLETRDRLTWAHR